MGLADVTKDLESPGVLERQVEARQGAQRQALQCRGKLRSKCPSGRLAVLTLRIEK